MVPTLVNAADYGVPQKRERVFIIGFRSDLGIEWSFPRPTHTLDALLHAQWVTGEYWDRHEIPRNQRPELPARLESRVRKLACWSLLIEEKPCEPCEMPWRTCPTRGIPAPIGF